MSSQARPAPLLRDRLVRHVLVPLALTWLVGSLIAIGVARYFTGRAFDRSLLDDAYMVASNVTSVDGRANLDMSARELDGVLFDQAEAMLIKVQTRAGRFIAGDRALEAAMPDGDLPYQFHDATLGGQALRAVTLRRDQPEPFLIVIAQTDRSRSLLLQRVLLYATIPQLVLLAALALWLRRAIGRDTEALALLAHTVDQRGEADLAPIEGDARTRDVAQLGTAINSLLARLARSLGAQREFAGNVAHELRTPLAGIRALAEYGLARKEPEVWRAQLERIVGSEARASRLVDQLLALALADEVRHGVPLESVSLDTQVHDAVMRFLPRADAAGVDLGATGVDAPVFVRANATLVEGILNNLIDNALRYARPADGSAGTVTVAVARSARGVLLSVSDNGPGLESTPGESLMQRWTQGDAGQALGRGVGLGLHIVGQYAQLMNAEVELGKNEPGGGLLVSVMFATDDGALARQTAATGSSA